MEEAVCGGWRSSYAASITRARTVRRLEEDAEGKGTRIRCVGMKGAHCWSRLVCRRRDRARLRYGVGRPARLSASGCCSGSLMEYSYCGPIDAGNFGLKRLLQKGKTLIMTTERGPADKG
jgi:hypothetical protein